jgi:hypothetical protein
MCFMALVLYFILSICQDGKCGTTSVSLCVSAHKICYRDLQYTLQEVGTLKVTSSSLCPIAVDYDFCHSLRPNPTERHSAKTNCPKLNFIFVIYCNKIISLWKSKIFNSWNTLRELTYKNCNYITILKISVPMGNYTRRLKTLPKLYIIISKTFEK